nr:hypothetical protein CFP56_72080 [Quercus suber]
MLGGRHLVDLARSRCAWSARACSWRPVIYDTKKHPQDALIPDHEQPATQMTGDQLDDFLTRQAFYSPRRPLQLSEEIVGGRRKLHACPALTESEDPDRSASTVKTSIMPDYAPITPDAAAAAANKNMVLVMSTSRRVAAVTSQFEARTTTTTTTTATLSSSPASSQTLVRLSSPLEEAIAVTRILHRLVKVVSHRATGVPTVEARTGRHVSASSPSPPP